MSEVVGDTGMNPPVDETMPAEPVPTEPAPAEPVPTEPAPAEPAPAEPAPAEPAPAEPAPAEPAPAEPAPAEPAPAEPAPAEPAPAEPAPAEPAPAEPAPAEPAPAEPAPVVPAAPVDTSSIVTASGLTITPVHSTNYELLNSQISSYLSQNQKPHIAIFSDAEANKPATDSAGNPIYNFEVKSVSVTQSYIDSVTNLPVNSSITLMFSIGTKFKAVDSNDNFWFSVSGVDFPIRTF